MKFGNLLKKELSQLLTKQAIISMIVTCTMLMVIGKVVGSARTNAEESSQNMSILSLDNSQFVSEMVEKLPDYGVTAKMISADGYNGDAYTVMQKNELKTLLIIPADFTQKAENGEKPELQVYTEIGGTGLTNMVEDMTGAGTQAIEDYLSDYVKHDRLGISDEDTELMNDPAVKVDFTIANGRTARIAPESVQGIMMSLNMILPMAIFFLLMMASTMIMTAISTEKIDKTLETLLSSPVSRLSVLLSKMLAAVIVALLNSLVMSVGFVFYMLGFTGDMAKEMVMEMNTPSGIMDVTQSDILNLPQALAQLGMSMSAGTFLLIGIELFLGIAIGLFASMIIGAMATDAQSLGTLTLPMMFLVMIPFMATMFSDINAMALPAKIVLSIIPFTHTYTALSNLMFGHIGAFVGGLIYQIAFLALTIYAAIKVFTTDLLFTMKLPQPAVKKK